MKKIIKFLSFVFILISLFSLTGCKKDPISIKEFKDEMESRGFKLYDSATLGKQYGARGSILASSSFEKYQVELYEFSSKKEAKEKFELHKDNVDSLYDDVTSTNKNKSNYSVAKFKTDDKVIIMYRVNNIFLVAQGPVEDETAMLELLEKFGY